MNPNGVTTIQEIFDLLDSVQLQLQQIRQRAKELSEANKVHAPPPKEGSTDVTKEGLST